MELEQLIFKNGYKYCNISITLLHTHIMLLYTLDKSVFNEHSTFNEDDRDEDDQ